MKNEIKLPIPPGGYSVEDKNWMVKRCLRAGGANRRALNDSIADEVGQDIYNLSLARTLFEPQIIENGRLKSKVMSASSSAIRVWLKEERSTVIVKNAYRDSVNEEETTTVRRSLKFVDSGAVVTDMNTFPVANVAKFKAANLNGTAYSMVDRAKKRMSWAMATDETRLAMYCVNWAADNRGRKVIVFPGRSVLNTVATEVKRIRDLELVPVVVCHPKTAVDRFVIPFGEAERAAGASRMSSPVAVFKVMDSPVPVYQHATVPEGRIYVMPSGRGFGVIGIAKHADIESNDKADKFLIGWTCAEEVGFVLANPDMVATVYAGWRGLLDALKSCFRPSLTPGSVVQGVHG